VTEGQVLDRVASVGRLTTSAQCSRASAAAERCDRCTMTDTRADCLSDARRYAQRPGPMAHGADRPIIGDVKALSGASDDGKVARGLRHNYCEHGTERFCRSAHAPSRIPGSSARTKRREAKGRRRLRSLMTLITSTQRRGCTGSSRPRRSSPCDPDNGRGRFSGRLATKRQNQLPATINGTQRNR
jgi:hypothetical protein